MTGRLWLSLPLALWLASHSTMTLAQSSCPAPEQEAVIPGPWAGATTEVEEGFEEGRLDLSYTNGFDWDMSRSISFADQGFSGSRALQFNYPAGENGFSEQRFNLGRPYQDLWVGFWLRVPTNWEHGTGGPAGNNNKFFAIWMDQYEREGPTGVFSYRGSGGDSTIYAIPRDRYNVHPGEIAGAQLIRSPEDRGRWMQVAIHVKMASAPTNKDGIFAIYRRWQGDSEYQVLFRKTDWENHHIGGNSGFTKGYLLGWANANQPEATTWLMDDFVISDQSLVDLPDPKTATPSAPEPVIPQFFIP